MRQHVGHGAIDAGDDAATNAGSAGITLTSRRGPPRAAAVGVGHHAGPDLRVILRCVDATFLLLGWWAARAASAAPLSPLGFAAGAAAVLAAGLWAFGVLGLYRRGICSVRHREVARLGVAVAMLTPLVAVVEARWVAGGELSAAAVAPLVWFGGLVLARGTMREWIHGRRVAGQFAAPVVVVAGAAEPLERFSRFVLANTTLGYRPVGLVGPQRVSDPALPPWVGDLSGIVEHVRRLDASGALLDARSLSSDQLNGATLRLTAAGLHVHVATGLAGVAVRRVTASSLADETFLHVAPTMLRPRQVRTKRLMDVLIGSLSLLLAAPVLVAAAVAIWLEDRGPVLFRQQRVGFEGEPFTMYKLRSMAVGAEARQDELRRANRRDGPLFKMAEDPRVTRVGRLLRALSIDEIPQLFNVVAGTMSLVGPRPALQSEVDEFDEMLRGRVTVKPGLTGLWQVEARDVPSFDLYRRYDMLYVRNWSVAGDLDLLGRTAAQLAVRGASALVALVTARRGVEILE